MEIFISLLAIILCWVWIECFLIFSYKVNIGYFDDSYLSLSKFKWNIRVTIITLTFLMSIYMFLFQPNEINQVISMCFNLILNNK